MSFEKRIEISSQEDLQREMDQAREQMRERGSLHFKVEYLKKFRLNSDNLSSIEKRVIEQHLKFCDRCRKFHDSLLPFE